MPDFDVDFCYERRQEVIDYVNEKYGRDHVAQIVTFGTMAARAAVRDVGRVMGMSYQDVDRVAKLIPTDLKMTLKKALEVSPDLKTLYDADNQVHELIDTSLKVEGMPRHASTHAAGVVITRDPATGAKGLFGEFLTNAQGEDVVAGVRTPMKIAEMEQKFPEAFAEFTQVCKTLEDHYRDMQDMEFTVEHGKLYMLQTRNGKRTAQAALQIACDLVDEGMRTPEEAVEMIDPRNLDTLLHPQFDA